MANFRIDIYSNPHKELRQGMFELSTLCARVDGNELKTVATKAHALFYKLAEHARAENTYAHPIISYKLPGEREQLEHEHEEHNIELAHLQTKLQSLTAQNVDGIERNNLLTEFYRALNRFIAHYLLHLDEEEYFMQTLWQICQPAELFAIMIAFKSIEEPKALPMVMALANQHLDATEKVTMFKTIHQRLGEEVFTKVFAAAKGMIAENEVRDINQYIGSI
jgi:hypothetical protein